MEAATHRRHLQVFSIVFAGFAIAFSLPFYKQGVKVAIEIAWRKGVCLRGGIKPTIPPEIEASGLRPVAEKRTRTCDCARYFRRIQCLEKNYSFERSKKQRSGAPAGI